MDILKVLHVSEWQYGTVPDWIMVFGVGLTIYFGLKGVKKQIASDQETAKASRRTNFTFNWEMVIHKGDEFWCHQKGQIPASNWKDGETVNGIPIFQNSGISQAFNVVIKVTYKAISNIDTEAYMKPYVGIGEKFLLVTDGWLKSGPDFVSKLDKIEVYYSTQSGERNLIRFNTLTIKGKNTIDLLNPEFKVLKPAEYLPLTEILKPTMYGKV